ncbi:MAG: hemerythrin domain-containing protein [Candidatus Omnitrophota bacterium]|nr:hemerythrin domain-containing protein [Candidatus Omnitrophota bacterium]
MECGCWDLKIREDHRLLDSQRDALRGFLKDPTGPKDRRVHLSKILDSLGPSLRLHLQREEETLFPAFDRLLGGSSGTIPLLRMEHDHLRDLLDRLGRLLEDRENTSWETIAETGDVLAKLLEDHEEKESRFITDTLEHSLKPDELTRLARQFQHAASCGCQGET